MSLPRREPRTVEEQRVTVEQRMTRGSLGGRSAVIAPVAQRRPVPPSTRGSSGSGGAAVQFGYDAVTVPSKLTLTHVPVLPSLHAYLNGVEQYEDTDWTFDSGLNRVIPQTVMDARTGDLFEARYAHNGLLHAVTGGSYIAVNPTGTFGNGNATVGLPTHVAGDILLLFHTNNASAVPTTPSGWTDDGELRLASPGLFRLHAWHKVADGTETSVTTSVGAGATWWRQAAMVYRGVDFASVSLIKNDSASTSWDTPGVGVAGRIVHAIVAGVTETFPPSLAQRASGRSGSSPFLAIGDLVGDGDPVTFTGASSQYVAVTIGLTDA